MHNRPELWQAAVCLLTASGLSAIAAKIEMPPVWRLFVAMAAGIFWFLGGLLLLDWIIYEGTRLIERFGIARVAAATAMSKALSGHGQKAQDYIAHQVMIQIDGIGGPLVVWSLTLPNGKKVPFDLVAEFVYASEEIGNNYLFPVRNHSDARFRDWINVEESLKDITSAFVSYGWADRAVGNQPAKLRVDYGLIRDSLGIN
jgi:hypothetical protein